MTLPSLTRTAKACALALPLAFATPASAQLPSGASVVVTATNDAEANALLAYRRADNGTLNFLGAFATGGVGTGAGLGNQSAIAVDERGRFLFVVNAGDDSVSTFSLSADGIELVGTHPSGGAQPVSIAVHGDVVYVLNSGDAGNIAGFSLATNGLLSPIANSTRALSGMDTAPAQIGISPDGAFVVVTERATNQIVTYPLRANGAPGDGIVNTSAGTTPFGFDFDLNGHLLVSEAAGGEAGLSTVSSYELLGGGMLSPITAAAPTSQSAACWLVTTADGRYAYMTNTASDNLTGLDVARSGELSLFADGGDTAPAGDGPLDAAIANDGRHLYILNGTSGSITGYVIEDDGSLTSLTRVGGLQPGTNGLLAL